MKQKIIQVGSSAAVVIPKSMMRRCQYRVGDHVEVSENPQTRQVNIQPSVSVDDELVSWTRGFVEKYKDALDELAQK